MVFVTMRRRVEPELMTGAEQARAYANADFDGTHATIMERGFACHPTLPDASLIADLGCGTGDIALRLARQYPECIVHAYDGSPAMLGYAVRVLGAAGMLDDRVFLQEAVLPDIGALGERHRHGYAMVASNSLLHHLHDPRVLWDVTRRMAAPGARVFIADLRRPDDETTARAMVRQYASKEPDILRRDFYNSLCAAFTVDEVGKQLCEAQLDLRVEPLGDRHLIVHGLL